MPISKITVVSVYFLSYSAIASDQWAMFQANSSHTGYIPITINPRDISFRWKKKIGTTSQVVAAGNYVFFSDSGYFGTQHLYAAEKNGKLAWGKSFTGISSINPPSYSNGIVYMQSVNNDRDTYLRAYHSKSGNFIFQSPHGAQWEHYLAPTIYKGTVYIDGGAYGGMYSFNGKNGQENWFYSGLPQVDGWTPAVDENWAYTYLGSLYVIERLTGKLAFQIKNSGMEQAVPMLGGLNDVFVIDGGLLSKFDTNTRKIAWQKIFDFNEDYAGQPALANSIIYAGTTLGSLVAINQNTGKILWFWKNSIKEPVKNNIVVTKTHVFFTTASKIYCIDIKTRKNVWSYSASGHLTLGESALYIASDNGTLTAFRLGIPDILTPSNVFFESSIVNTVNTKKIAIINVGDKVLTVHTITSDSPIFEIKASIPFLVLPHQTKFVTIDFKPKTNDIFKANLTVKSDDENESETIIHLKGNGVK